jgi:hypothetical protein
MSELAELKFMVMRQEMMLSEVDRRLVTLGKVISCAESTIIESVAYLNRLAKAGYPIEASILDALRNCLAEN